MFSVLKRKADSPRSPLPHPAASGTSSASGACESWAAFWLGCFAEEGAGCVPWQQPLGAGGRSLLPPYPRPATPAPGSGHEHSVHLTSSRTLTFSAACAALTFLNPAPGLEKPLNETHGNLLAGQTIRIPFRAPRQEGFC